MVLRKLTDRDIVMLAIGSHLCMVIVILLEGLAT